MNMSKRWLTTLVLPATAALVFAAAPSAQSGWSAQENNTSVRQENSGLAPLNEGGVPSAVRRDLRSPLNRSVITAFLLPEMKTELNLTSTQVNQLDQFKQRLIRKDEGLSNMIAAKENEVSAQIAARKPDRIQLKNLVNQITRLQADRQLAAYDTVASMKAVLSSAQLDQLASMQPMELGHAFLSHITVGNLTEMARVIHDGYIPLAWTTQAGD
jgi:hypothetical protein